MSAAFGVAGATPPQGGYGVGKHLIDLLKWSSALKKRRTYLEKADSLRSVSAWDTHEDEIQLHELPAESHKLRDHPAVLTALNSLTHGIEKDEKNRITRDTYDRFVKVLCGILIDGLLDANQIAEMVNREWQVDSRGEPTMSTKHFEDMLFQLVANWSDFHIASHYESFLNDLLVSIQQRESPPTDGETRLTSITSVTSVGPAVSANELIQSMVDSSGTKSSSFSSPKSRKQPRISAQGQKGYLLRKREKEILQIQNAVSANGFQDMQNTLHSIASDKSNHQSVPFLVSKVKPPPAEPRFEHILITANPEAKEVVESLCEPVPNPSVQETPQFGKLRREDSGNVPEPLQQYQFRNRARQLLISTEPDPILEPINSDPLSPSKVPVAMKLPKTAQRPMSAVPVSTSASPLRNLQRPSSAHANVTAAYVSHARAPLRFGNRPGGGGNAFVNRRPASATSVYSRLPASPRQMRLLTGRPTSSPIYSTLIKEKAQPIASKLDPRIDPHLLYLKLSLGDGYMNPTVSYKERMSFVKNAHTYQVQTSDHNRIDHQKILKDFWMRSAPKNKTTVAMGGGHFGAVERVRGKCGPLILNQSNLNQSNLNQVSKRINIVGGAAPLSPRAVIHPRPIYRVDS